MMCRIVLVAGLVTANAAGSEWKQLFNGEDLNGWEHVGEGRVFVEDGLMKTAGGMGLLWFTLEKFGDCRIRVVFRTTSHHDNSGVFIRIPAPPQDPWQAVHTGYEVQILERWPDETHRRSKHQETYGDDWHKTGALYSLSRAEKEAQNPPGEWNTMEIVLNGQRTTVYLNDEKITDFHGDDPVPPRQHDYEPKRGPRPDEGYMGIQNHHEPAELHFKEISVKR